MKKVPSRSQSDLTVGVQDLNASSLNALDACAFCLGSYFLTTKESKALYFCHTRFCTLIKTLDFLCIQGTAEGVAVVID